MNKLQLLFWCGLILALVGVGGLVYSANASDSMWTRETQSKLISLQTNALKFQILSLVGFSLVVIYFIVILVNKSLTRRRTF